MRIAQLRTELPAWTWQAARHGLGWRYLGTCGARRVEVYAVAQLCGPLEDDYSVQWRVDDGQCSSTYAAFWIDETAKLDKKAK